METIDKFCMPHSPITAAFSQEGKIQVCTKISVDSVFSNTFVDKHIRLELFTNSHILTTMRRWNGHFRKF